MTDKRRFTVGGFVLGTLALLGIFATPFAVQSYLNTKVDERVNDPEFIRKVATQVRPSVIFNHNGSILADLGAMQFVDKIEVSGFPTDLLEKLNVIVYPKLHLPYPPLIESVDSSSWFISSKRGVGYQWSYELNLSSSEQDPKEFILRMEIIR